MNIQIHHGRRATCVSSRIQSGQAYELRESPKRVAAL